MDSRQTIPGPLREESDGDDDPHALAVSGGLEQCCPTHGIRDFSIQLDCRSDLSELEFNKGVFPKLRT